MKIFILIWTLLVFSSIAWYALLLFFIGYKGGHEIRRMTKTLGKQKSNPNDGTNA